MARARQPTFFPLSFENQDIYFAELDSIADKESFTAKLNEVDVALSRMVGRENLIVHLEATMLTRSALDDLACLLIRHQAKIRKLGVVGVRALNRMRLTRSLKRAGFSVPLGFDGDYQRAKERIVATE